jgi:hypothetical protein
MITTIFTHLVNDTVCLVQAMSRSDLATMRRLAACLRRTGWEKGMPRLASAAGALEMCMEESPASQLAVAIAVQAVADEMRLAVHERH